MSEPEISRRCLSCGASVRQLASFCPQCGEPLDHRGVHESAQSQPQPQDQATQNEERPGGSVDPFLTQPLLNADAPKILETPPRIPKVDRPETMIDFAVPPRDEEPSRPEHEQAPLGRVEKIKKVSSVMIDQAAYDPSLRFLLVAAVLFVIFLVLIILSKVIG